MQHQTINGRYQIESRLGRGNQGDVLLARDLKLDRLVALKMLRITQDFADNASQSLRREAMIMARFHNANVVSVYDYDVADETRLPFLVMEYLKGQTLDKLSPPLTDEELCQLVTEIGNAMQDAHDIGLVHRDLKPANLMLVDRGEPKQRFMVLDLGIAKLTDVANQNMKTFADMTYSGAGTPFYMSPEQAKAESVDHRSDIYALGSIIYQLISGRAVYKEAAESMLKLLNAIIYTPATPLSSVAVRTCTPELNELVMQCLEKDPTQRPENMREVVARFQSSFAQNFSNVMPPPAPEVVPPPIAGSQTDRILGAGTKPAGQSTKVEQQTAPAQQEAIETQAQVLPTDADAIGKSRTSKVKSDETSRSKTVPEIGHPSATQPASRGRSMLIVSAVTLLGVCGMVWAVWAATQLVKQDRGQDNAGVENGDENGDDSEQVPASHVSLDLAAISIVEEEPWRYPLELPAGRWESLTLGDGAPDGMSIDANTKELSWTPSEAQGPSQFQIQVHGTSDDGKTCSLQLPLRVEESNRSPVVEPIGEITIDEMEEVRFRVNAIDPDTPLQTLSFRLQPGHPENARIDESNGTFRWTPSERDGPGDFEIVVEVSDGEVTELLPVSMSVAEVNKPPTVRTVTELRDFEGSEFSFEVEAADGDFPEAVLHFTLESGPDGATFDSDSRRFRWIPTEEQGPGEFMANFVVSDGDLSSSVSVVLIVDEVTQRPVIGEIPAMALPLAEEFEFQTPASDPDIPASPLAYALHNAPTGMSIDSESGKLRWHPAVTHVGDFFEFEIEVSKSDDWKSRKAVTLEVVPGRTIVNSIGMELRRIPSGRFEMGSSEEEGRDEDEAAHEVTISRSFLIGCYEVTQAQYAQVMDENPSYFKKNGEGDELVNELDTAQFPVERVSWEDAQEFCDRLNELESDLGRTYRLPTEAEWEYACRAGTSTPFFFGDRSNAANANLNGRFPYNSIVRGDYLERTCEVGSYAPNRFGLYDMHGNVSEWCQDWYAAEYDTAEVAVDPTGPESGIYPVQRGGSWRNDPQHARSADRNFGLPSDATYYSGFRVVCVESR